MNYYHSLESLPDDGALEAQFYIQEIERLQPRSPRAFGYMGSVVREHVARRLCWFIPHQRWVDQIVEIVGNGKVLELCAGTGFVASLFLDRGVSWIATDIEPATQARTQIDKLSGREAVDKYLDSVDFLFWSWWPYEGDEDDLYALKKAMEAGVPLLIVGEHFGGCTGSGAFWVEAAKHNITYPVSMGNDVLQWPGINDFTQMIRRSE